METTFSIQQVAERTGLSIDTLRYYERIGLLEPVNRAASGHRRYRQQDIDWIGLIINLRETGMPLTQIAAFAELRRQGEATASERLEILEQHQQALVQQMQRLEQHMIDKGLLLRCDPDWIALAPPLITTMKEADEIVDIVVDCLRSVLDEG